LRQYPAGSVIPNKYGTLADMPKISIITPCFNAEKYIAGTVESVLTQTAVRSGRAELEYIICDGNSSDRTIEIVEQTVARCGGACVRVLSETDSGIYDALAKGLQMATGDICAYINAGDYYNEHAFDVVLDVFSEHKINWLTGMTVICNDEGQIVSASTPCGYRNGLIKSGLYGPKLPFIQQESTFWKRELNEKIDFKSLARFKYAGDYFLWYQFAQSDRLALVETHLGTFRIHKGQISEDRHNYFLEIASFCDKPGYLDRIAACYDKLMWHMPRRIQMLFPGNSVIRYNHLAQAWELAK
jgi:glycosyltransferase involved in cell wall biosynthesis